MAFNTSPFSQLGFCFSDFVYKRQPTFLNLRIHLKEKIKCLSQIKKIIHVEEDTQTSLPSGFHKDLNFLPKPLSATNLSCDDENVRVAFQGVRGAYSEAAALKAYPKCETVPCDQFEDAFKAVELCLVDKAMVPIENTVDGSIQRNYDLLIRHKLHIVGEVQVILSHRPAGLPGSRKEEQNHVLSHPQDDRQNVTRFLILAREPIIPAKNRPYKTSVVFTLEEGPGVLFKALAVFALRDINLSKIESRPQKMRSWGMVDDSNSGSVMYFDYLFYIDFQASMAECRAQKALRNLQELARFLRVLGCYPMDTVI